MFKNGSVFHLFRHLLCIAILFISCVTFPELVDGVKISQNICFICLSGLILITYAFKKEVLSSIALTILDLLVLSYFALSVFSSLINGASIYSQNLIIPIGMAAFYLCLKNLFSKVLISPIWYNIPLLALTGCQIVIGILQYQGCIPSNHFNFRFTGFFQNPAPYSILLSALIASCVSVVFLEKSALLRTTVLVLFLAGLALVILSFSRAAFIALLLNIIILLELNFGLSRWFRSAGKYWKIGTTIVLIVAGSISGNYLYHLKKASADGRVLIWKVTLKMIQDNPLGVGSENFSATFLRHQADYFIKYPERIKDEGRLAGEVWYAFNDILQITAEKGFLGLAIFLALLFFLAKNCLMLLQNEREKPTENGNIVRIGTPILIGIIVGGWTSYPLTQLPIQALFFSTVALISSQSKNYWTIKINTRFSNAIFIVSFIIGIYLFYFSTRLYKAYNEWYLIKSMGYEDNDFVQLESFQSILSHDGEYQTMNGTHLIWSGQYAQAVFKLEAARKISSNPTVYYLLAEAYSGLGMYSKAEDLYQFMCSAIPNLLRPQYLLAKLYYKTGQKSKWAKQARKVMEFNPKVLSDDTKIMQEDIRLKQKMSELKSNP